MAPNSFRRELIISAAFIFGGILLFTVAFYFITNDIVSQSVRIVADRALIAGRQAALDGFSGLKQDVPQAQVYREAMNKILVTQDQLFDFPRWLDGLSRARRVELNFSFDGPQTAPSEGSPGWNGFSVAATGALQDIVNLIKDMEERSPRFLVTFSSFNISRVDPLYKAAFQGKIYFK